MPSLNQRPRIDPIKYLSDDFIVKYELLVFSIHTGGKSYLKFKSNDSDV